MDHLMGKINLTSKIQIIPVRHRGGPIKTFYYSIQPTQDNTIQGQKVKSTIWQSYTQGALSKIFTKQTQYHKTKQLKKTMLHKLWGFIFKVFKLLHSFKPWPLTCWVHTGQVMLLRVLFRLTCCTCRRLHGTSWCVF